MSGYTEGNADRDAFFAALGRVFEEFGHVSSGYGICNVSRLAELVGGDLANQVGISKAEKGKIVTEFLDKVSNPIADKLGDECITFVPEFAEVGLKWTCVTYRTS